MAVSTKETLQKAREVLQEAGWRQGDYFTFTDPGGIGDGDLVKGGPVCAAGALRVAAYGWDYLALSYVPVVGEAPFPQTPDGADDAYSDARHAVMREVLNELGDTNSIPAYNDAPGRTVEEVLALFDKAIEHAPE